MQLMGFTELQHQNGPVCTYSFSKFWHAAARNSMWAPNSIKSSISRLLNKQKEMILFQMTENHRTRTAKMVSHFILLSFYTKPFRFSLIDICSKPVPFIKFGFSLNLIKLFLSKHFNVSLSLILCLTFMT